MSTPFTDKTITDKTILLDPAQVDALLEDIEGGQPNLLHIDDTLVPLKVEVPQWPHSDPAPDTTETLWLSWNGVVVVEKHWSAPVQPEERVLMIEARHLVEGLHRLDYRVKIYNGEQAQSQPLSITIDKTAPALGGDQGMLEFPAEVVSGGVTVAYLADNDDQVQAGIPDYREARAGDVLTWYWDAEPFEFNEVDSRTLAADEVEAPLVLTFSGDMIRARGDGPRYVHYRVQDRAGNAPVDSRPVGIDVAVTPIPRELHWLHVEAAAGVGELLVLDPDMVVLNDLLVALDPATQIHPDEEVWVQWGEPGTFGAFRGRVDTAGNPRSCRIPKASVAIAMGKTAVLYYEVLSAGQSLLSTPQWVRVQTFPVNEMPTVQCAGHMGGVLSLAAVPPGGAKLTLARWKLISTDQLVRIVVTGVAAEGGSIRHEALYDHRVTGEEVGTGIGSDGSVVIARAFLARLMLGQVFSVKVYVSFDLGETWPLEVAPNFPLLSPRLLA
ncbi:MAG: hypothetical protein LBJ37_28050 [Paucimonas sp.]|jgi:hypothetical protein|nr:hypothetical protein [Paucimonas sp.]